MDFGILNEKGWQSDLKQFLKVALQKNAGIGFTDIVSITPEFFHGIDISASSVRVGTGDNKGGLNWGISPSGLVPDNVFYFGRLSSNVRLLGNINANGFLGIVAGLNSPSGTSGSELTGIVYEVLTALPADGVLIKTCPYFQGENMLFNYIQRTCTPAINCLLSVSFCGYRIEMK